MRLFLLTLKFYISRLKRDWSESRNEAILYTALNTPKGKAMLAEAMLKPIRKWDEIQEEKHARMKQAMQKRGIK